MTRDVFAGLEAEASGPVEKNMLAAGSGFKGCFKNIIE
jgi:hypothetical protein